MQTPDRKDGPNDAKAQSARAPAPTCRPPRRTVIGVHLILTLAGHWGVNDPRGSGSSAFHDPKFAPLGPIHQGRKPAQPPRAEVHRYHREHEALLNFPRFWMDDAKTHAMAQAIEETITNRVYTCYACAICSNHVHLVIRTHKDRAATMNANFEQGIRQRLRLRFPDDIPPTTTPSSAHVHTRFSSTHPRPCGDPSSTCKPIRRKKEDHARHGRLSNPTTIAHATSHRDPPAIVTAFAMAVQNPEHAGLLKIGYTEPTAGAGDVSHHHLIQRREQTVRRAGAAVD